MTRWIVRDRRLIRVYDLEPEPRPFREQVRDEVLTIIALAIPIGVIVLVWLVWGWRQ